MATDSPLVLAAPVPGSILTVADMADPVHASNNCWAASAAVLESGVFGPDARIIGLECPAFHHYAVAVTARDGAETVIDYTARQLDRTADFPLVTDRWSWQLFCETQVGRQMEFAGENHNPY